MTSSEQVRELRSPRTIRARCKRVLDAASAGETAHFAIDREKLSVAAERTVQVTKKRYPELRIPPHSRFGHFDALNVPRLRQLEDQIARHDARERARILTDVVITSVLLDAGAGSAWRYHEAATNLYIGRSEGLAVASLAWAESGGFSSRGRPFEVDAAGLKAVDEAALVRAFQVRAENPLVGVSGRVHLLRELGAVLEQRPDVFGKDARLGAIIDCLWTRAEDPHPSLSRGERAILSAPIILETLLDALGSIWPGRLSLDGVPLGDVWRHPAAGGRGDTVGLVPFHKLSQWLTYSLLHPIAVSGLGVANLDELTGLAEYRNGGLFVDTGVLVPKHDAVLKQAHEVGSEVIVEFRALTVALLDELAPLVRKSLGLDEKALPLAAVLEGGTWAAGRALAEELRPDAGPPIRVISDGTVF